MNELFYYNKDTDELLQIGEITALTLDVSEEESSSRLWESLDPFEGTIEGAASLEFHLAFKSWEGIVPRQIGVRI